MFRYCSHAARRLPGSMQALRGPRKTPPVTEIWLHANRRAAALDMLPAVAAAAGGLLLALGGAAG